MGIHRMPVQLLKGVFMWVPLGVVGIGLTAYVFQQLPNRLPKMARVMGSMDPNSASEMNAAASPDIRRAGRVESPRAVDRGHLPNATMPPSVQIGSDTNDPKVFPKSSMPADANHGKNLTVEPQIDVETLSMLKQLRELEPESDAAKAIKSQMLDRLLTEFSRNQEQQKRELNHLRQVVVEWEANLALREKMRREIVESQLATQLGRPNPLHWEYRGKNMLAPSVPLDILLNSGSMLDAYWEQVDRRMAEAAAANASKASEGASIGTVSATNALVESAPVATSPEAASATTNPPAATAIETLAPSSTNVLAPINPSTPEATVPVKEEGAPAAPAIGEERSGL